MTASSLPSVEPAEITRSFGLQSTERGKSYAASGRVSNLRYVEAESRVEAEVSGSQPLPYRVDLRLLRTSTGRHLYGLCTCPMRVNCKHAAAVAFLLADTRTAPSASVHAPMPASAAGATEPYKIAPRPMARIMIMWLVSLIPPGLTW